MKAVFSHKWRMFIRDKGMLFFYFGSILAFGIVLPLLIHDFSVQFSILVFVMVSLVRQWTADSIAGERENRTLESILSAPVSSRSFLFGNVLFVFTGASGYGLLQMLCLLGVDRFFSAEFISGARMLILIICLILALAAETLQGVFASARSEDVRTAGRKTMLPGYLLALCLMVASGILTDNHVPDFIAFMTTLLLMLLIILTCILFAVLLLRMNRSDLASPSKRFSGKVHSSEGKIIGTISQTKAVFLHEWAYFLTLKSLIGSLAFLIICPAVVVALAAYYWNHIDLNYAVLITILMLPRIPSNLVAYAVGGEKVYKTGESLLSTPVSLWSLLAGKCALPMLVSAVILISSSGITLLTVNLADKLVGHDGLILYTAAQAIFLFLGGALVSFTMILISAILSLKAKSPRRGLYLSTLLGFIFVLPVLGAMVFPRTTFFCSFIYCVALMFLDIILCRRICTADRASIMTLL